jgi:metal-sulfur cluster biosynthetic enzyme
MTDTILPDQTIEHAAHGTWSPDGEVPPAVDEDAVISAIATVYDPEIPVNVYELGLIYAIEIAPGGGELPVQVRDAVLEVAGVTACEVETVWNPPWDPSRMTDDARLQLNMF